MKQIVLIAAIALASFSTNAQDVFATVSVNTSAIQQADPAIFKTLDQKITDFVNLRRWTTDDFASTERIELNINLTLTQKDKGGEDIYRAKLTVQASRPVYGTDYKTSLLNYIDKDVLIRYNQFQNLDFNENRIVGNDIYSSNLTAILAFYVYYAVGLDYDSYSLKGGTPYFNKALNIVQNAPELEGWKREGGKNRYWLVDNIVNSRFDAFRQNFYEYHRDGMDQMTTDKTAATKKIKENIKVLSQLNKDLPNSAVLFMYFSAKSQEYVNILTESTTAEKEELCPLMAAMDVTNAAKYTELAR
ncbi:MAG: hypothetical protein RL660_511 [Bacteroidota bacterium]|jgi:hypothetical protein